LKKKRGRPTLKGKERKALAGVHERKNYLVLLEKGILFHEDPGRGKKKRESSIKKGRRETAALSSKKKRQFSSAGKKNYLVSPLDRVERGRGGECAGGGGGEGAVVVGGRVVRGGGGGEAAIGKPCRAGTRRS